MTLKQLPWKPQLAVGGTALVIGTILGFFLISGGSLSSLNGSRPEPSSSAISQPVAFADCATSPGVLIPVSAFSGFRKVVDTLMATSPTRTIPSEQNRPPAVTTYVTGRLLGFIADKAYGEPYISQSQARQRQLGYAVTDTPMIPLQGQIVADTPGFLEVYQLITAYAAPAGAQSFQLTHTTGYSEPSDHRVTMPGPLSDATAFWITPVAGGEEYRYQVDFVLGRVQFDFQFRGGNNMSEQQIVSLISGVVERVQTACHPAD